MGATQFRLLCTLGLRECHTVLDFGCGSLRAGRLLLPYLSPGNHYGLEPNRWLIEDAIERQLGQSIIDVSTGRVFGGRKHTKEALSRRRGKITFSGAYLWTNGAIFSSSWLTS